MPSIVYVLTFLLSASIVIASIRHLLYLRKTSQQEARIKQEEKERIEKRDQYDEEQREAFSLAYQSWLAGRLYPSTWQKSSVFANRRLTVNRSRDLTMNYLLEQAQAEIDASVFGKKCFEHAGEHSYVWVNGLPICITLKDEVIPDGTDPKSS